VDLDAVISRTAESLEPAIAERAQHLTVTKAPAPPIVSGDPTRLQQIFSNLLHNASRYTPPGGHIDITSFVEPGWTRVEVRDDGSGIEPSHLATIFEPFTRRSAEGPGLGIGLSLARRLVEMHGGTITAQSEGQDFGSLFTVRLPLAASQ
jgi:signal transduction histidine kinase